LVIGTSSKSLKGSLPQGWSRNRFIENERDRKNEDYDLHVFTQSERHPMGHVSLSSRGHLLQIVAIEGPHREGMSRADYNAVVEEFRCICAPIAEKLGLKMGSTSDQYDISKDINSEAMRAFRAFSHRMSTSQGSEQQGFLDFIVHTHRSRSNLTPGTLRRWLIEVENWPEDRADRTAGEYGFGRDVLKCNASM
jgi:hypothetical protein